jgi:Transposase DDE domain
MLPQTTSNQALYLWLRNFLQELYQPDNMDETLLKTLAMMLTGMLLGPHVQLFAIAMCIPVPIKLTSLVRRLERFVANEQVQVERMFAPFIYAMVASLGNETAYLIIDCTQAGPKCRTLFIALAYQQTVLPLVWQTVKGKKGHVKSELHQQLLRQVYRYVSHCRRVIVLGDAEFSNEAVITTVQEYDWDFVLRFQSSYLLQTAPDQPWRPMQEIYTQTGVQAGQTRHWSQIGFTQAHQLAHLTATVQWETGATEPLCLVSNLAPPEQPHLVYERRYWVETLFGNCKSRGFQLARTEMETPAHLDRLVLAVAIATCLTLGLGTHLIVSGHSDQVDRADRRDLSLFQIGWRWLYRLLALNRLAELKIVFRWDFQLPPPGFQPAR